MEIKAWIQMGVERRVTRFKVPKDEFRAGLALARKEERLEGFGLEAWLEEYVLEWMEHQYGWGWSGAGFHNDFGFMEGSDGAGLETVEEAAIPHTLPTKGAKA